MFAMVAFERLTMGLRPAPARGVPPHRLFPGRRQCPRPWRSGHLTLHLRNPPSHRASARALTHVSGYAAPGIEWRRSSFVALLSLRGRGLGFALFAGLLGQP